jgi:hypothetical protein
MVSAFFKRVARHFANEVAVVTPNGKLLSHSPRDGLKSWQNLPRAERTALQDLGRYDIALDPAPPLKGLILKVYARGLVRDSQGNLQIYKTKVARSLEAGRDHLWLTESEKKSLVPARPHEGDTLKVADAIVDRIYRNCLIDLVRVGGNGGPRRHEQVLAREMRLTVVAATADAVRLRLDGSARLATSDAGSGARGKSGKVDTYQMLGFATFDVNKESFTRLDLVALSETGHFDEINHKTLPFGVAFELTPGKKPADRLPPSSFGKDYFK